MSDLTIRFEQPIESRPEIQPVQGDPFIKPATLQLINELTVRSVRLEAANDRLMLENTRLKAQLAEFKPKQPAPGEQALSVFVPYLPRPVLVHFTAPDDGRPITREDISRIDLSGCDISRPDGDYLTDAAEAVNAEIKALRRADQESRAESILATMGEPIV